MWQPPTSTIDDTSADEHLLSSLPLSILMPFFVRKIAKRCKTFLCPPKQHHPSHYAPHHHLPTTCHINIYIYVYVYIHRYIDIISQNINVHVFLSYVVLICPCEFARGQQQDTQLPPRPPLHPVNKASEWKWDTCLSDSHARHTNMCLCLLACQVSEYWMLKPLGPAKTLDFSFFPALAYGFKFSYSDCHILRCSFSWSTVTISVLQRWRAFPGPTATSWCS